MVDDYPENWRSLDDGSDPEDKFDNPRDADTTFDRNSIECPGCGKDTLEPFFLGGGDYCTDCIRKGRSARRVANRPRKGDLVKVAHDPTYDVSLHDPQQPGVGASCQFCGVGGDPTLGAVHAFADPRNPVSGRIVAHASHFEEYREAATTPTAAPIPTVVPAGEGKGVVINIYANRREPDEVS